MIYLAVVLCAATLILSVATLIGVKKSKNVSEISKQDKDEITGSFSSSRRARNVQQKVGRKRNFKT